VANLGRVPADAPELSQVIRIRNIGDEPQELHAVDTGCGCIAVRMPHPILPAGALTELELRFNLRGRRGHFTREVIVRTNDPERPEVRIRVEADIESTWELWPTAALFGTLRPDAIATQSLRLVFANPRVRVRAVTSDAAWLSGQVEGHGNERVVRVIVRPPYPNDRWILGRLWIETDDPAVSNITIAATARIREGVGILPRELELDAGKSTAVVHLILGDAPEGLRVTRMTLDRVDLVFRQRRLEDGRIQIAVENLPPLRNESGELWIYTEPAAGGPHRVPVRLRPPKQ